ncbi:MAG: spherulation-specific family 4 protein [Planctomycetes bacterium]|nr:spherulation-specific family 4 protein [Planctomycetota bacterium]
MLLLCSVIVSVCGAPVARAAESPPVRLLVPAYFYPSGAGKTAWDKLLDSAARTPIVAIVNPDSGPGKRADDNYREIFRRAAQTPLQLIGYVTLSYAQRPVSAVKADIDSWLYFYPEVQGIFFDEQPSSAEQAAFAIECFAYARQRLGSGRIVTNPGVPCARTYLAGTDAPTACLFEHETGFDEFRMPDWAASLSPDRFAVLLYNVANPADMKRLVAVATQRRFGFLFITDRQRPNPWDGLPIYWDDLVSQAAAARLK